MENPLPRITVVTPSFNQGHFIEQTILSVLGQQYPNLEYIIMDGGSTDETLSVIRRYEHQISYWQSERDNGQGSAINAGFRRATGDILCWLNSDDMFMPGALRRIAKEFKDVKQRKIVFGNCLHFHMDRPKTRGSDVMRSHARFALPLVQYIIQPSSFWTRAVWEATGETNESLNFAFDWDWYIRAQQAGTYLVPIADYLSMYRIHEAHKSGGGGSRRAEELIKIAATYNDPRVAKAFAKWIRIYNRDNSFSKFLDAAQRYDIGPINSLVRFILFNSLSREEFRSVVAMN